jgi:hypothetical protein
VELRYCPAPGYRTYLVYSHLSVLPTLYHGGSGGAHVAAGQSTGDCCRAGLLLFGDRSNNLAVKQGKRGKFAGQGPCVEPPGGIEPPTFSLPSAIPQVHCHKMNSMRIHWPGQQAFDWCPHGPFRSTASDHHATAFSNATWDQSLIPTADDRRPETRSNDGQNDLHHLLGQAGDGREQSPLATPSERRAMARRGRWAGRSRPCPDAYPHPRRDQSEVSPVAGADCPDCIRLLVNLDHPHIHPYKRCTAMLGSPGESAGEVSPPLAGPAAHRSPPRICTMTVGKRTELATAPKGADAPSSRTPVT